MRNFRDEPKQNQPSRAGPSGPRNEITTRALALGSSPSAVLRQRFPLVDDPVCPWSRPRQADVPLESLIKDVLVPGNHAHAARGSIWLLLQSARHVLRVHSWDSLASPRQAKTPRRATGSRSKNPGRACELKFCFWEPTKSRARLSINSWFLVSLVLWCWFVYRTKPRLSGRPIPV